MECAVYSFTQHNLAMVLCLLLRSNAFSALTVLVGPQDRFLAYNRSKQVKVFMEHKRAKVTLCHGQLIPSRIVRSCCLNYLYLLSRHQQRCQVSRFRRETPYLDVNYGLPFWQDLSPVFTFYLWRVRWRPPHARW